MNKCFSFIIACALLAISCVSQEPKISQESSNAQEPATTETGIPLDKALSDIVSYYVENLSANTKIALINFEAETQLLSDYIFEELWIHFEDSRSFILIDRQNLELIQKEIDYQYSGLVSDESMQSIGHQLGAEILVYGNINSIGSEYRLVVRATDVEKAVTSIRSATVKADRRFAVMLETKTGGKSGRTEESMANALYSGLDNPWRFTV
jgi:curli biogenesis system outer membrane secretion channel CsgG